jgi:hypothetical protein
MCVVRLLREGVVWSSSNTAQQQWHCEMAHVQQQGASICAALAVPLLPQAICDKNSPHHADANMHGW